MSTLFVNACVRSGSRTRILAETVLDKAEKPVTEHNLADMQILPLSEDILNFRNKCVSKNNFEDKLFNEAKEFARAAEIVIAAPYWDLSFPAVLKAYIERIMVCKIVFEYGENGVPRSLCRAKKLTYVSTAGGPVIGGNEGFAYVNLLAHAFWGIKDVRLVQAQCLDVIGADVDKILSEAASGAQV